MKANRVDEDRLITVIKEAVRETLREELMNMRLLLAPYIANQEQQEIEKTYKKPSKRISRVLLFSSGC